jgi:hypothetical protein
MHPNQYIVLRSSPNFRAIKVLIFPKYKTKKKIKGMKARKAFVLF